MLHYTTFILVDSSMVSLYVIVVVDLMQMCNFSPGLIYLVSI